MSVRYADAAPVLHEQGWGVPVPFSPELGRPLVQQWPRYRVHDVSERLIELWCERWPDEATAIVVNPDAGVAYLDIDFDEAGPAMLARSAANETLGHTSHIRIGRDPRQVRLYRQASPIDDIDTPGLELKTGGRPGLITLFGIHGGTGQPYHWPDQHPLSTTPADLPVITPVQVANFMAMMAPFAKPRGGVYNDGVPYSEQPAAPLLSAIADNPDVPPLELLASVLAGAVEGCRHTSMFGAVVAAAMRGFTDGEIEGALLPVFQARFPGREQRAAEREFRDALHWIRKRRMDRDQIRERVKTAPPWIKRARGLA